MIPGVGQSSICLQVFLDSAVKIRNKIIGATSETVELVQIIIEVSCKQFLECLQITPFGLKGWHVLGFRTNSSTNASTGLEYGEFVRDRFGDCRPPRCACGEDFDDSTPKAILTSFDFPEMRC